MLSSNLEAIFLWSLGTGPHGLQSLEQPLGKMPLLHIRRQIFRYFKTQVLWVCEHSLKRKGGGATVSIVQSNISGI